MVDLEKLIREIVQRVISELTSEIINQERSIPSNLEKQRYIPPSGGKRVLITAEVVRRASESGMDIEVPGGAIITPLARDTARQLGVKIVINNSLVLGGQTKVENKVKIIGIGSDHGGYHLKENIKNYLDDMGYMYKDFGTHSTESVDYPDFAAAVARAVSSGECDMGIVIDGAGIGSAIAANKIKGILAAVCHDRFTARIAREHDNANILALGSKVVNEFQAKEIVRIFLTTEFAGGRHVRRIDKIFKLEESK